MSLEELYKERDDVNAALAKIRNGAQSYSTTTRSVTKVSYESLLKQRDRIEADIAMLEHGGQVLTGWPGR